MKIQIQVLALLISILSPSFQWEKSFKDLLSEGWTMEKKENTIIFTKTDSITINCCALSPLRFSDEPDQNYKYRIFIERSPRVSSKETEKRTEIQKSILDSLEKKSRHKLSHGNYRDFLIKRNTLDSLRVPVISKGKYSFFITDEVERLGYLNGFFKNEEELFEIIDVRKKIFTALKVKYQDPNWKEEYGPIEYYDTKF